MEPALLVPAAAVLVLGLHLVTDLAFRAAVAIGRTDIRLAPAIRTAIVGCVAGVLLVSALRMPAAATTPPPAVRLSQTVNDTAEPTDVGSEVQVVANEDSSVSYTVVRGDSLWRIAKRVLESRGAPPTGSDVAEFWRSIYESNRTLIGSDPNLIHPGQVFMIPGG
jgi:hypothetical protein